MSEHPLAKFLGAWKGDDLDECLAMTRGKGEGEMNNEIPGLAQDATYAILAKRDIEILKLTRQRDELLEIANMYRVELLLLQESTSSESEALHFGTIIDRINKTIAKIGEQNDRD